MNVDPAQVVPAVNSAWHQSETRTQAGYGFSLADLPGQWQLALQRAAESQQTASTDNGLVKAIVEPLNNLGDTAASIKSEANALVGKQDVSPGEIVRLTMRCHEYLFRCELTSNVANRTSDGIQQLFRQQS